MNDQVAKDEPKAQTAARKVKQLKQRAAKAWERRSYYDQLLRDVYDYVIPYRDVTGLQTSSTGPRTRREGERRTDKVFDATAVKAAYRFAGRMQTDVVPLFQEFFALEAGPLLREGDDKKQLTEELQRIGALAHGVLMGGEFGNASHEMFVDLYAGMGHLQILEGDEDNPIRVRVVPVPEVAVEEGPFGGLWGWFWKRKWRHDELKVLWPKGTFSPTLLKAVTDNPDGEVEITQYTYFDAGAKDWKLVVWSHSCSDDDKPFWTETFRTCPWVSPRFFKVPGEPYGRGPANLAMPFVKTANKARELALKAAALAVMGIWMRRDDGVFNPDTVRFEPLAMWQVASTGGALGPSLARLPIPQDFDVSSIVMADEREQMKMALFDETLPPESAAVRSATEIAERIARLGQDFAGAAGRLTLEFVVPTVIRVIDVLEQLGLLKTALKIDQMVTAVRLIGRLMASQYAHRVQSAVQWLEMLGRLGGQQLVLTVAKVEELGAELGRWLGIPERFIRSTADKKALLQMVAEIMAQAQKIESQVAAPPEPPSAPYVNGGAM